MPTITRLKDIKKPKRVPYKQYSLTKYYNSSVWRSMSLEHRIEYPLDELELLEEHTVAAKEVHHIVPFSSGSNDREMWYLLTNTDNLISLSRHTHELVHHHIDQLTTKQQQYLAAKRQKVNEQLLIDLYT